MSTRRAVRDESKVDDDALASYANRKASDIGNEVRSTAQQVGRDVQRGVDDISRGVSNTARDIGQKTQDAAESAISSVRDVAHGVENIAHDVSNATLGGIASWLPSLAIGTEPIEQGQNDQFSDDPFHIDQPLSEYGFISSKTSQREPIFLPESNYWFNNNNYGINGGANRYQQQRWRSNNNGVSIIRQPRGGYNQSIGNGQLQQQQRSYDLNSSLYYPSAMETFRQPSSSSNGHRRNTVRSDFVGNIYPSSQYHLNGDDYLDPRLQNDSIIGSIGRGISNTIKDAEHAVEDGVRSIFGTDNRTISSSINNNMPIWQQQQQQQQTQRFWNTNNNIDIPLYYSSSSFSFTPLDGSEPISYGEISTNLPIGQNTAGTPITISGYMPINNNNQSFIHGGQQQRQQNYNSYNDNNSGSSALGSLVTTTAGLVGALADKTTSVASSIPVIGPVLGGTDQLIRGIGSSIYSGISNLLPGGSSSPSSLSNNNINSNPPIGSALSSIDQLASTARNGINIASNLAGSPELASMGRQVQSTIDTAQRELHDNIDGISQTIDSVSSLANMALPLLATTTSGLVSPQQQQSQQYQYDTLLTFPQQQQQSLQQGQYGYGHNYDTTSRFAGGQPSSSSYSRNYTTSTALPGPYTTASSSTRRQDYGGNSTSSSRGRQSSSSTTSPWASYHPELGHEQQQQYRPSSSYAAYDTGLGSAANAIQRGADIVMGRRNSRDSRMNTTSAFTTTNSNQYYPSSPSSSSLSGYNTNNSSMSRQDTMFPSSSSSSLNQSAAYGLANALGGGTVIPLRDGIQISQDHDILDTEIIIDPHTKKCDVRYEPTLFDYSGPYN